MSFAAFFSRAVPAGNRKSLLLAMLRGRGRRRQSPRATMRRDRTATIAEILEDRTLLAAFSVNVTADTIDANPGDGVAQDAGGNTSLRAAIMEANALAGTDTIDLPSGTYALTIANTEGQENAGAEGDLDITDDLTVIGGTANPEDTRVNGGAGTVLAIGDRVFHVLNEANVTFRNLGIEQGSAVDDGTAGALSGIHGHGGGVLVVQDSIVTFDNVDVENNTSTWSGGGIYNEASTVNVTNDTVVATNIAVAGGGIYATASGGASPSSSVVDENERIGKSLSGVFGASRLLMVWRWCVEVQIAM